MTMTQRDRVWRAAIVEADDHHWRGFKVDDVMDRIEEENRPSRKTVQRVLRSMSDLGVLKHSRGSPRYKKGEVLEGEEGEDIATFGLSPSESTDDGETDVQDGSPGPSPRAEGVDLERTAAPRSDQPDPITEPVKEPQTDQGREESEDVAARFEMDVRPVEEQEPDQDRPDDSQDVEADPLADVSFPESRDREECIEAVKAAAAHLRLNGPTSMREFVDRVMPFHSIGYDVPELEEGERYRGAWWRLVVKPGLRAHPDVEAPPQGGSKWKYTG